MAETKTPAWLEVMREITGMLEEPGADDNPKIMAMADFIGDTFPEMMPYCRQYTHDSIAWCGLTVAYCMAKAGIQPVFGPTDSDKFLWARAWTKFGTLLTKPKLGAVMVFVRDGGGHVALYEGENANNYSIRGGNQGDRISVMNKPKSEFIAAVWPGIPAEKPEIILSKDYLRLKPEYDHLLDTVQLTRPDEAMAAARKVIKNSARYKEASIATGVPWPFIGALDLRESDCNPSRALGQGDPWNQVSVNVPRGKGPFKSWVDAAIYYIGYDHLTDNVMTWDMPSVCWKGEKWNGLGPRNHGIFTGYLWAGTNHYTKGKYVSDGVWDPDHVDTQLGIVPVLYQMVMIDQSTFIGSDEIVPSPDPPPVRPDDAPFTLEGTMWIQSMLNILMPDDEDLLRVDGDYGHNTSSAVRNFQARHGLEVDGDAGDLTTAAIDRELKKVKQK